MKSMKGQAAMEYLMTYGWALVALVVVIAALMATGVFNPSYMVSEECSFQPDLACGSYLLYNDGEATYLKFEVRNGLGYDIKITDLPSNILVKTQGTGTYDWVSPALEGAPGGVIKQGGKAVITLRYNGETPPLKGELMKMLVQLTYVSCAPEVNPGCSANAPAHTISGRIVARVEEKG